MICVRGWTKTVRPLEQCTGSLRGEQIRDFGYADLEDELEGVLAHLVCSGRVPIAKAKRAIATYLTAAYNRYVVGE